MSGSRLRRVALWSTALLAVVVVAGGLALGVRNARGNNKKKAGSETVQAAPVELTPAWRGTITTWLESTTTLEARNAATLVATAQGQVRALEAEEGDWVRLGQELARLDDTEARLAVERAEVAARTAEREAERGRQLRGQGYLSDRELDDLELKVRSARVARDEALYHLGQTRITAPFSGRVTARLVNLGETVTAGRECFRIEDFDPLLARLHFPEREVARVRAGQPALLSLDASPGRLYEARVSLVNPVVERANGTFKVTLEVRDPARELRPGNFVRVRLRTGQFEDAVLLPRRALLSEDGDDFVFVARGDTVRRVAVSTGAVSGDTVQVLAGLQAGDRVVTVGQGGLKQGARIKPARL